MNFSTKFISSDKEYSTFEKPVPAPLLRRSFVLSEAEIIEAELTICGLGFYELFVNGQRMTKGYLSPYLSNPDDILYYDIYDSCDLKPHLHAGENVIGIILGNGLQNNTGAFMWGNDKVRFRSSPKVALDFSASLADGSGVHFEADENVLCHASPIIMDDLRAGEWYDARLEVGDWTSSGYDTSNWHNAIRAETPRGECRIADIDPIVVTKELTPIDIYPSKISHYPETEFKLSDGIIMPEDEQIEGGYLYDFGVNAAGVCRLHIKNAKAGQKLVLQFGEKMLDGGMDLRNLRYLPMRFNNRDIYICKGGEETWTPSFTYHGFRYVLVGGLDEDQATPELLTYCVMNTKLDTRATFRCSDEITNKLWDAATVSNLANFYHFSTDCPHREKQPWTGDAALSAEEIVFTLTPERNWREWLRNIQKTMRENGDLQGVAPCPGADWAYGHGVAWDNITIMFPYYAWLYRGNTDLCIDNAAMLMRYMHFLSTKRNENGLIDYGLGDWVPAGRIYYQYRAPLEFTGTVLAMDYCAKAKELFHAIGMSAEAFYAEALREQFYKSAREFLIDTRTMTALGRCQTSQAMAIYYNLFTDDEKPLAVQKLIPMIEEKGGSFDCGILGMRVLFHVLSAYGYAELAHHLITKPEFPSFGYQIVSGSTSLWESFWLADREQSSLNHHFFGDIISWFMQNLAGLQVNPHRRNPAEIRFHPRFIDKLDYAEGTYNSVAGEVSIRWERQGEDILCRCSVPEGSPAEFICDIGWQVDDGLTVKRFSGTVEYLLIREGKPDRMMHNFD